MAIRLKFSDGTAAPTLPETGRPLRVMVFPDRPDVILIYVPNGTPLRLPEMQQPFDRAAVVETCRQAGIAVRVSESKPGRFKEAMRAAELSERAERNQQQRLTEASLIAKTLDAPDASSAAKQRVQLMARRHEVDDEARKLKVDLAKARTQARRQGNYDPSYRQKEARLEKLKTESQLLQFKIGEAHKIEKLERSTRWEAEQAQKRSTAEIFMHAAKQLLSQDALDEIWSEMLVHDDADDVNASMQGEKPEEKP